MNFLLPAVLSLLVILSGVSHAQAPTRVMPVGDSITEGAPAFSNYRYPLWEKLFAAGYRIEYVGTKTSPSRIGPLRHEGYSGGNAEFLAETVVPRFKQHPADIVLLHAGHNHSVEEKPVSGILEATARMIEGFRAVNPKVSVLLARPVPAGKLPKYAYLPELQPALEKLARKLDHPGSRVITVPQDRDFKPGEDTIADLVHPSAKGAAKMADRWFEAMVPLLGKPEHVWKPEVIPYKKTAKGDLCLHVFGSGGGVKRPAIVFFFGGGWKHGTPLQFYPECAWFAARGYVAVSADYRIASTHRTSPIEAVADAKSAIRWVRSHAAQLGVDPQKIVAAGASAGGHLAAAAANSGDAGDPAEDPGVSGAPNANVLWYPVLENKPADFGEASLKARHQEISPILHTGSHTPPTLVLLGTKDPRVPVGTARDYQKLLREAGVRCELELFEGGGHPLYEYRKGESPLRARTLQSAAAFLQSIGFR